MAEPLVAPQSEPEIESDAAIVAEVLRGQINAFERLMRRYNALIFRTARSIVKDDATAEDCAQRAWIAAYDHLAQWKHAEVFGPWVARIAYREALRSARKTKLRAIVDIDSIEKAPIAMTASDDPERDAQRSELRAQLEAGIDELPEGLREVFVLCEVQALSARETSHILGLTEENVRVRNHRARQALRARMAADLQPELAFSFDGARCDRMVSHVLSAIGAAV